MVTGPTHHALTAAPRPDLAAAVRAGFTGTAAMTLSMWLERRTRRRLRGPVDYDASTHVVTAASNLLRISPRSQDERRALFLAVHWGYGSFVGVGYGGIRRLVHNEAFATVSLYSVCQTMALVLFPTVGETPPPWRWRKDMLISSLVHHGIYAGTVAWASRRAEMSRAQ